MMNDDDVVVARASGREAVEDLRRSGALDALFERLDAGEVEMTGSQGLLPALLKEALERGLAAELTQHLGYEKGQTSAQARSNTRNGTTKKTVMSEVGAFEIEVPRDRAGSFTPRLVRKGQRRLDGLDSMIISLYAGGMTVRDIRHHLASTLGVEVSAATISTITDAVCDAVLEWQHRPLEAFYPVIYLDAIRIKIRSDHTVENRAAHLAVGVDMDGVKHVLGIWVQADEGAAFWAHVCAELANRGVRDVLIVCCDGLSGLPEAIEATWPQSMVQTCVVHLIRASMRFVSYKDRKSVAAALKRVYSAPNEETAREALEDFAASDLGGRYPQTVATWKRAWQRFTPFLAFPPMLRRVVYTTNAIESLNYQLRKITKNRGHFPSEEAAVKLLWLAICDIEDKRAAERLTDAGKPANKRTAPTRLIQGRTTTNWKQALAQLTTAYPDRITPYLEPPYTEKLTGSMAAAMNSGPLSARSTWGAPWVRAARSSISITSAAPIRRSTRKARCWRVNSSMRLQTLNTRPLQSESNWKSMAHTCPGALAVTRRWRRGAVRGLGALRGRTRSPSVRHKRRNVSRPTTTPSLLARAQARL